MLDGAILGKQVQRIQILDDIADQAINNVFYFDDKGFRQITHTIQEISR